MYCDSLLSSKIAISRPRKWYCGLCTYINDLTASLTGTGPNSHRKSFRVVTCTRPLGRGVSTPLIPRIIVQGLLSQMSLIMHGSIPHNPVGLRKYSYFLTCYIDFRNFTCNVSNACRYMELLALYSECLDLKLAIIT
jgi:hypothetical protein